MAAGSDLVRLALDPVNWKPELYDAVAADLGRYPFKDEYGRTRYECIYNAIRRAIGPELWDVFDYMYCSYKRPDTAKYIIAAWNKRGVSEKRAIKKTLETVKGIKTRSEV